MFWLVPLETLGGRPFGTSAQFLNFGCRQFSSGNSKPMKTKQTETRIVVSDDRDVIIQGSAQTVLFLASAQTAAFMQQPATTPIMLITDLGAAAIQTMLAAEAKFSAQTIDSVPTGIPSFVLRFRLPNGLVVAYTTDEVLAADPSRLTKLGVDLTVTDAAIDWRRQHAPLIAGVIANIPPTAPQLIQLEHFDAHRLAALVRDALTLHESATKITTTK